jgi:hypothetical protein
MADEEKRGEESLKDEMEEVKDNSEKEDESEEEDSDDEEYFEVERIISRKKQNVSELCYVFLVCVPACAKC